MLKSMKFEELMNVNGGADRQADPDHKPYRSDEVRKIENATALSGGGASMPARVAGGGGILVPSRPISLQ